MPKETKATAIGLTAIIAWSTIVAFIRSVSEHFGAIGGGALIYTVASVILLATRGFPDLRAKNFPRTYLFWGALMFVVYELCLALSVGFAQNEQQTIEVAMVNYLWPTFTILAAVTFTQERANLWIIPGFLLSIFGIVLVLQDGDAQGFSALTSILDNVQTNPLSYGLAFLGACLWAAYSTVTARYAQGADGITLFFMLVALTLWVMYGFLGDTTMVFRPLALWHLLLAAAAMGLGYAAWNVGILHGNLVLLAGASYFIPVLSALFAALWLNAPLPALFWVGAGLVTLGSTVCWLSVKKPPSQADSSEVI